MIRGYPNGVTRQKKILSQCFGIELTRGTETSKYPEEKKIKMIPKVVASEMGLAQTGIV